VAFLPYKHENLYSFESHIEFLPFLFVIFFLIISWGIESQERENNLTPKLTKGVLLIQSLSIIYFFLDFDYLENPSWLTIFISSIGSFFCLFSFFFSFSSHEHSAFSKLILSIWSSIITAVFGIYYCIYVFKFDFSSDYSLNNNAISFVQYFFLGIISIYIFQNLWMLMRFLPAKNESMKEYKIELEKLKSQHKERFLDNQVHIISSFFCLIFVGGIYFMNYTYNWMPSYTMICLAFTFFPFIIFYFQKYK